MYVVFSYLSDIFEGVPPKDPEKFLGNHIFQVSGTTKTEKSFLRGA